MVPGQGIGPVGGIAVAADHSWYCVSLETSQRRGISLTLAVAGHMALLVGHVGNRRERVRHTAVGSLAVDGPVAGRSSPGLVAVAGSLVAGSHPVVPSLVAEEGIGLEAGIAGSLGCIDRRGQT
jgi:hypothetical protein